VEIFHPHIWRQQLKDALVYWFYLPALVLGAGKAIDLLASFPARPSIPLGIVTLIVGGAIVWWATSDLADLGGGTPSPFRPPKKLVTQGSYRFCRHPMWLGYDIMALGVILLLGSTGSLCISFPLFLGGQIIFLRKEEKILLAKFPQAYREYQQTTAMLLPHLFSLFRQGDRS